MENNQSKILAKLCYAFRAIWWAYASPLLSSNWWVKVPLACIIVVMLRAPIEAGRFQIPELSELKVSTGTVYFDPTYDNARGGKPFGLRTHEGTQQFRCGLIARGVDCIAKQERDQLRGRPAKVWWFQETFTLLPESRTKALFQLEVDGRVVIPYSQQAQLYREQKDQRPFLIMGLGAGLMLFIYFVFNTLRLFGGVFERQEAQRKSKQ